MPRQPEPNANNAMGGLLQSMLPRSRVRSENTQAIAGRPGLRPDILITAPGRAPLVVEAEHLCMTARGIRKPGALMITSAMRGRFRDDENTRQEFLGLIRAPR